MSPRNCTGSSRSTRRGKVLINRKMPNTPTAIGELIGELQAVDADVTVGVDMTAGTAGLLLAMLVEAGVRCVYLQGASVARARRQARGGENKTDPRDARAIADQLRIRSDLRDLELPAERDAVLRVLTSRREDLRQAQTARTNRLRDLLQPASGAGTAD